jgi:hypothetical protein
MTRRNGLLQFLIAAVLLLAALFAYRFLIANGLFDPFLPYRRLINSLLLAVAGIGLLGLLSLAIGLNVQGLRRVSRSLKGGPRVLWILVLLLASVLFSCLLLLVYFVVMIG